MEKADQTEQVRQLTGIGSLLPDLFAVFDDGQLSLVSINAAGKALLDPSGKAFRDSITLADIVGVNEIDRFHREIYPQTRVHGSWAGALVMRDISGSEFTCRVKLLDAADGSKNTGRLLYLYAVPLADGEESEHLVSDRDMLSALLETVPDRVYFKDITSRFLRISKALATKFEITSPRDAIGKTDFDFFTPEHAAPAFQDEQSIIKTNQPLIGVEEKETYNDGTFSWVSTSKLPFYNREGKLIGTYGISRDITASKVAEEKLRTLSRAVDQSPTSIVITDVQGVIEYVNPCFEKVTGYTAAEVVGQSPRILKSGNHPAEFYQAMWDALFSGREWTGEIQNRRKNGQLFWERASLSGVRDARGMLTHFIAVKEDITEQKQAEVERRDMETKLQLTSKLESVGSLAAGVAHEINTPTQFISDNVRFLIGAFAQLELILASHRELMSLATSHPECAEALTAVKAVEAENELDYLSTEIPRCLEQSLDGLRRISKIVGSLKEFSHPGGEAKGYADINRAIETTVAVSKHEWKYVADVATELDSRIPKVNCVIDEINQAILNLIINATHAIEDANKQTGAVRGLITIRTKQDADSVIIEVQDSGTGIPENVRDRIFEPFYTTKPVGKGTGQGLAIVQAVVVKKHHGDVSFTTELGKGTTFRLSLPLKPPPPGSSRQTWAIQ